MRRRHQIALGAAALLLTAGAVAVPAFALGRGLGAQLDRSPAGSSSGWTGRSGMMNGRGGAGMMDGYRGAGMMNGYGGSGMMRRWNGAADSASGVPCPAWADGDDGR